jgi:hypothetical protein
MVECHGHCSFVFHCLFSPFVFFPENDHILWFEFQILVIIFPLIEICSSTEHLCVYRRYPGSKNPSNISKLPQVKAMNRSSPFRTQNVSKQQVDMINDKDLVFDLDQHFPCDRDLIYGERMFCHGVPNSRADHH